MVTKFLKSTIILSIIASLTGCGVKGNLKEYDKDSESVYNGSDESVHLPIE
jgi:predicted small lipoprotein YifL